MYSSWARPHRLGCLTSSRGRILSSLARQPLLPRALARQARHFTLFAESSKPRPIRLEPAQIIDFFDITRHDGGFRRDVLSDMSVHVGSAMHKKGPQLENLAFTAEDLDTLTRKDADIVKNLIFQRHFEPFSDDFWWERCFQGKAYSMEAFLSDVLATTTPRKDQVAPDIPVSKIESAIRCADLVTGVVYTYLESLHGSHHWIKSDTFKEAQSSAKSGKLALHSVFLNLLETFLPTFKREPTDRVDGEARGGTMRPQNFAQFFRLKPEDVIQATQFFVQGPPYHHKLGFMYNTVLSEAIFAIQADLKAPSSNDGGDCYSSENGFSGVLRPVTVLQFPQVSGQLMPDSAINDIAAHLKAHVIHINANSISRLLELEYPVSGGSSADEQPMSMLRFHAARNSGRMLQPQKESTANSPSKDNPLGQFGFALQQALNPTNSREAGTPAMPLVGINMPDDDSSSSALPNSSAGRVEQLHELRIKLNAGLKLIFERFSKQSPILIHIHDAVAISMDAQSGNDAYAIIRGFVEYMRSQGGRAAVVATCSSARAPEAYHRHLKQLQADDSHRVMQMQNMMPSLSWESDKDLAELEYLDFGRENAKSIVRAVQLALPTEMRVNPKPGTAPFTLNSWPGLLQHILPYADIARIARATIGSLQSMSSRPGAATANDPSALEMAATMSLSLINRVDELKRNHAMNKEKAKPKKAANVLEQLVAGFNRSPVDRLKQMIIKPKDIRTTFADIHVPKDITDSVKLLTELSIKRPQDFSHGILASERIRGLLLYGPPGTGKTLLAKAVAKESGAHMIEVSVASLINKWAGESEKNIKALFDLAKRPGLERLVIFIDEADSMLGSRDAGNGSSPWRASVTNQFLREMDGMGENGAFVMMATNRPHHLDEALLRRLPRKLLVELPLEADRAAILRLHLQSETLDEAVSVEELARRTPLYSGSDLKNVCVAAAMSAVKETLEAEAASKEAGDSPTTPVAKRVLAARHFEVALAQISASVSEDMAGLKAIKDFDKKYGDAGAKRNRKPKVGFGQFSELTDGDVPILRR